MLGELIGVPRPVLETVFGRILGRRIWEQNREVTSRKGEPPPGTSEALPAASDAVITGPEIVHGLIKDLSRHAADTLRQGGRKAGRITLELIYADGTSKMERMHLGTPTDESRELMAAAQELILKMPLDTALRSISVHISSVVARSLGEEPERIEPTPVSAVHALACAQ